jgi:AcrR family transcriptional regulator
MPNGAPTTERSEQAIRRKQSLIEAAVAVFGERGFDVGTTREIAERAGCSEGLIYKYFDSKREILFEIEQMYSERLIAEVYSAGTESDDLCEEIYGTILGYIEFYWHYRDIVRVISAQSLLDADFRKALDRDVHGPLWGPVIERLRRHQVLGHVRDGADLHAAGVVLAGVCHQLGIARQLVAEEDRDAIKSHARQVADLVTFSLRNT